MRKEHGRPSKYKEEYCEEIVKFFDRPYTVLKEESYTDNNGMVKNKTKEVANTFPTFQRFAFNIGVNIDTLHEWRKVHPSFSEAFNKCVDLQRDIMIQQGMSGKVNAQFSMLVAKSLKILEEPMIQQQISSQQIVYIDREERTEIENHIKEVIGE
jgi:hypothetical protein